MKTCCTTTTIPTTCPTCDEFVDACCVIQQYPLPCLFPEPDLSGEITASGSNNSLTITATVNNNLGIKVGDFLTSKSTLLVSPDSMVTSFTVISVGTINSIYSITLDKAAVATESNVKLKLVRYRTEIPQCDVNKAINDYICNSEQDASACCSDWVAITDFNASGEYEWSDATGELPVQGAEYLVPGNCNCNTVKLRGTIMGPWLGNTTLLFTLPAGIEPLKGRGYSVNVFVKDKLGSPTTQDIFPALIYIVGQEVYLTLKEYCCNDEHSFDPQRWILFVTLEGISFETNV